MQQPITHLSLVPTQLWRLLREGFDPRHTQLRELLLGGAAIPAPLVERLQRLGLTPKVSYGLSEMASQVCTGSPSAPGVVGQPLPGRQVRVVDGEIQVKGDTLFCGYLADGALDPAVNDEAGSPPVTGATSTTSRRSSSKGGSTTYSFPAVKTYSQRASSSGWSTTRAWPRRWWWPCRTRSGASARWPSSSRKPIRSATRPWPPGCARHCRASWSPMPGYPGRRRWRSNPRANSSPSWHAGSWLTFSLCVRPVLGAHIQVASMEANNAQATVQRAAP